MVGEKIDKPASWKTRVRASLAPLEPLSINKPSYGIPIPHSDDLCDCLDSPLSGVGGFQSPSDKFAFFDKECSKIIDYIFLGSDSIASNRDVLLQNGITHVLNCVGFVCPEYFKNDFVYKTLWLHDSASEDITSILYDVFDYFEDVKEHGGKVFVHCCKGISRSTSLVIAYLMWKEEQSFEDAFQKVKAARGVTNPNMGFAVQLSLCQKSLHALPASPKSMLRIYRMAPHCPYDPLHLVPKRLTDPSVKGLDSRGAFIIHIPSAIYIWIGNHCISLMAENAKAAAFQVIRYEKAKGPAMIIKEGEEPLEFWKVLGVLTVDAVKSESGQRHVPSYNIDFMIFHKAVSGGVVPPFSLSGNQTVTCLPARETGWNSLDLEMKYANQDIYQPSATPDFAFSKLAPGYAFPAPSPSNSESSSSFLFSPTSSNWSDFSYISTLHSPDRLEGKDSYHRRVDALDDNDINLFPSEERSSAIGTPKMFGTFSPSKGSSPSLREGRESIPVPGMMLPSVPLASQNLHNLSSSYSISLINPEYEIMKDVDCQQPEKEDIDGMKKEASIADTDIEDDNKNETVKFRSPKKAREQSFFAST